MEKHRDELIEALAPIEATIQQIKNGEPIPSHTTSNLENIGVTLSIHLLTEAKDFREEMESQVRQHDEWFAQVPVEEIEGITPITPRQDNTGDTK